MSYPVERWQNDQLAPNTWQRLDRQSSAIVRRAGHEVLVEQGRALRSAAVVRGAAYIGDELMTDLDQLRRHEARASAEDPVVADEYTAVRRAVFGIGLDEIHRYGRRP
jgi:hypothetical protein